MHYIEDENNTVDVEMVEKWISEILSYLGENGDFSLHFITDEEMRSLNKEYRIKMSPLISSLSL